MCPNATSILIFQHSFLKIYISDDSRLRPSPLTPTHPHPFAEPKAVQVSAQGNSAQDNSAQGNSTQGNSTQGNSTQGNSAQGNSAPIDQSYVVMTILDSTCACINVQPHKQRHKSQSP